MREEPIQQTSKLAADIAHEICHPLAENHQYIAVDKSIKQQVNHLNMTLIELLDFVG